MNSRGSGDSDCESTGSAANVGGKVAEDQTHSDRSCDGDEATSVQIGHSDHSTCRSNPTIDVLYSDSQVREEAMSERTSSASSGSQVKQEELVLGINGGMTGVHSSQTEERTPPLQVFPNSGRGGGSPSSAGGGGLFHVEEPLQTSDGIQNNSLAKSGERGANVDISNSWHIPSRSNSAPVDKINGGQKLPGSVELPVKLAESMGMAVATVFHEVFERNGDFRTSASPVDELSGLLGAALKESLFLVLGNERANFVENFRNSFRSAYQTMRSVSRASAKSGDKMTSSRQRNPNSWRASPSKPRRFSPGQLHRERNRKNLDKTFSVDSTKQPGVRGVAKDIARTRHLHYTVESVLEEEATSCTPKRYAQHDQRLHSPCSSGKSCLDESLQSSFFTKSSRDPEGYSYTAGSCGKSCLNESLESSFFTSSNPDRGGQDGSTKNGRMNSASDNMGSLLPVPTPDAKDVHSELSDSEDSWGVNIFSATSSIVSDEFVIGDKEVGASAHGQKESGFVVTFDSRTPKKDSKDSRRVAVNETNPPPKRCVVDSMQDTKPVVSPDTPGRSLSGDSTQHTKAVGSSDGLGRCVVGDSIQEIKSVGSSDSRGSQNQNSLNPGTLPMISRNSSGTVPVHSSVDHSIDRPIKAQGSQDRTFGASSVIGEGWPAAGELRTNLERTARGGAGLLGRPYQSEAANYDNTLAHRRLAWGEDSQLTGPSLEESVLPPFFNYGVRANTRQTLLERYVEAQERYAEAQETQNHLRQLELSHSMNLLLVKKDHIQLQSESNDLMRENVDLSRSKIELKEFELEDGKLTAAHRDLSQTCADELVAGLCVMLLALAYSAWKFSYTRLSRVVTMCQLPPREARHGGWLGTNWMANTLDAITWQMQALTCEVTKAGRMLGGLVLIALITSALLRRSVTSSSQTMPATIIIVVLGGLCGFAGKFSIDSLGGDGYLWLLFWETLCFLHAFATTCTPWLYKYLYGPSSKFYQSGASSWMKLCSICARFSFHTLLAFALPVMTGLLPFASLNDLNIAFWQFWEEETITGPF